MLQNVSLIAMAVLLPVAVFGQDAPALAGPYEPDEHTLLLYHFEGEGDEILDASSQELHGRLARAPEEPPIPPERGEGIFGASLKLADQQFIQLEGSRECLRGMDELTAELWFKTTNEDTAHRQRLIIFWEHYLISVFEGNRLMGHLYDSEGNKYVLRGHTPIVPGVWYHTAITFDGERGRLWLNGVEETSARVRGPISDAPGSLSISTNNTDAFIGEMDELRISNVARKSFIAARQRNFASLLSNLALSPGVFRANFLPVLPEGAEGLTCTASLAGGATESVTIPAEELKTADEPGWMMGEAQLAVPVPEGVEGEGTVTCAVSYRAEGREHSVSSQFPVRMEPMIAPPEKEFRAAWTHISRIEDPEDLFSRMEASGLNAAIMRSRRGETAFFNSKVGPLSRIPFDNPRQMEDCLAAAEEHGIDLHPYVNCFNIGQPDSDFAQQLRAEGRWQKSWRGDDIAWLCPADPANVEIVKQGMLEMVRDYPIKGIQYDFIRYPNSDGCYCDRCRAKFEEHLGKKVENWPEDVRDGGPLEDEYLELRASYITEAVRDITAAIREIKPEVMITAATFSRSAEEAKRTVGQDWLRWCKEGLLDALCPMSYQQDTAAYEQTVQMILEAVDGAVPVYAGIGLRSSSGVMRYPEELAVKLNILRRLGAPGFSMFCVTPTTDAPENVLIPLRDTLLAGDGR